MEEYNVERIVPPKVSRHGKACVNCARAKVKCVEKNGVGACERCHRLAKDCQSITRTKRRKPVKKTTAAKTAELEQKLDGLVSLLNAANRIQITTSSTASDHTAFSDHKDNTQSFGYQDGLNSCNLNPPVGGLEAVDIKLPANSAYSLRSIPIDSSLPGPPQQPLRKLIRDTSSDYCGSSHVPSAIQPNSLIPSHLELSSTESENALKNFQTHSTKYLPFIVIPPDTKVCEFMKENPFWWLAIAMTTAKTTSRQMALDMHIRQTLGQKLLIQGERNLDLLWGLLTYIAWSQCHYQQRPVWSSMVQLAMGLVYDLGLNKAPPKEAPHLLLNFDARGCPKPFLPPAGSRQENRALLCLFSLSSSFSLYVQKIDTLRWTSYAEESAKLLSEHPESDRDILMVQIIPNEVRDNHTFLMHLYNTELTIHELSLSKEPVSDMTGFQRLESLCICFQSVKSWFDLYFSLPFKEHTSFVFPIYTHLAHCIVALYRLSVFEDPQWDVQLVRQQLDFSAILDRIIKTWENVRDAAGLDEGMTKVDDFDIYTTNSKRIALIKTWWDAKVAAETSGSVPSEKFPNINGSGSGCENISTQPMALTQTQGLEIPTFAMDMGQELWDDGWWQDVFGAWGTQGDTMTVPSTTHF
ncbi:hypothetical protein EYC80_003377 [Monilinia laxa]|uniref:Zn(2)-C6 fungal-type domain-containing protein n=1 Tax=Monilinia laxa TaxID=61186 RepID=A0A5N6KDI1_MONLA|nr:hypothetical protein EYC80_003377 [Monilinia laxa]